jgi:hypothetical protein
LSFYVFDSPIGGVSLQLEYQELGGEVEFFSAHVLGEDYQPAGPNIVGFLHGLIIVTSENPMQGLPILSLVAEEILNDSPRTCRFS